MKRKFKRENLIGVTPKDIQENVATFTVYKSPKKGQTSFRVTKVLLDSLLETEKQINKKPYLIITISDGNDTYTLTCNVSKSVSL